MSNFFIEVPLTQAPMQKNNFNLASSGISVIESLNFNETIIQSINQHDDTLQKERDPDTFNQVNDASWGQMKMSVPPVSRRSVEDYKLGNFICDIIMDGGLTCDTFIVRTEDGFDLSMFRMRDPSYFKQDAPAVLLQHGLLSDSVMWVTHLEESLGFVLARQGYDVWLGNNRGSLFSRNNIHYDPIKDYAKYADYSFYELGKYDLPAQMNKILQETGHEKISYIGHSQGTSQMFSALADQQTFQDQVQVKERLNLFIALAPIVNLQNNPSSAIQKASKHWSILMDAIEKLGIYEIRNPKDMRELDSICSKPYVSKLCSLLDDWLSNKSPYADQTSWDLLQTLPVSSASIKQLVHYGQIIVSGNFKQFDYGSAKKNMKHYGSATVPELNLNNIPNDVPLALFAGLQDNMADPLDVKWLREKLVGKVYKYVELDQFDHQSFSIGKDMSWTSQVVDLMSKFSTTNNVKK